MSYRLIDFDASVVSGSYCGVKQSSATIVPPEMIHTVDDTHAVVRLIPSMENILATPYALLTASFSYDIWSLGVLLYSMCTGSDLFQCNRNGTLIFDDDLLVLAAWTDTEKMRRLSCIKNLYARNLVSMMLNKKASKRPNISQILAHPFLTNKKVVRMNGDRAMFDVFLSYRVVTDISYAEKLYHALTAVGFKVFWDKMSLLPGEPWEEGFCRGLANSAVFVPLISRDGINHPTVAKQNFSNITSTTNCDNVFLEHRLALELQERNLIEKIFPLYLPDSGTNAKYTFSSSHPKCPDVFNVNAEAKLRENLERIGMGLPFRDNVTVSEVMVDICKYQGGYLLVDATNPDVDVSLQPIVKKISDCVLNCDNRQHVTLLQSPLQSGFQSPTQSPLLSGSLSRSQSPSQSRSQSPIQSPLHTRSQISSVSILHSRSQSAPPQSRFSLPLLSTNVSKYDNTDSFELNVDVIPESRRSMKRDKSFNL